MIPSGARSLVRARQDRDGHAASAAGALDELGGRSGHARAGVARGDLTARDDCVYRWIAREQIVAVARGRLGSTDLRDAGGRIFGRDILREVADAVAFEEQGQHAAAASERHGVSDRANIRHSCQSLTPPDLADKQRVARAGMSRG